MRRLSVAVAVAVSVAMTVRVARIESGVSQSFTDPAVMPAAT